MRSFTVECKIFVPLLPQVSIGMHDRLKYWENNKRYQEWPKWWVQSFTGGRKILVPFLPQISMGTTDRLKYRENDERVASSQNQGIDYLSSHGILLLQWKHCVLCRFECWFYVIWDKIAFKLCVGGDMLVGGEVLWGGGKLRWSVGEWSWVGMQTDVLEFSRRSICPRIGPFAVLMSSSIRQRERSWDKT